MNKFILKNAMVYDKDFNLKKLDILIQGENIEDISEIITMDNAKTIDLSGKKILPGFIDVHIHGRGGHDTCDNSVEGILAISEGLVKKGITSFCPTSMTLPSDQLTEIFRTVKEASTQTSGAYIHGINMEGPYISLAKKGAQSGTHVRTASISEFEKLKKAVGDEAEGDSFIKIVTIAPECEGAEGFIKSVVKSARVAFGHSDANYAGTSAAITWGISHFTHLYNAMNHLTSREPGAVGAVFDYAISHPGDNDFFAELICDGHHIHPATLRIAFSILGQDRAVIVSDAMKAAGLSDGEFDLGGQIVYVKNGLASLADGTIAASTTNIFDSVKFVISIGIPEKHAVMAATINPAKVIGANRTTGSIEVGKNADFTIVDSNFNLHSVFVKGVQKV